MPALSALHQQKLDSTLACVSSPDIWTMTNATKVRILTHISSLLKLRKKQGKYVKYLT